MVVARVRARENEQHDALSPVQTFVNAHMQVRVHCLCLYFALFAAPLPVWYACSTSVRNAQHCAQHCSSSNFVQLLAVP